MAGSLAASSLGGTQARRPLKTLDLSFNALSKIEGGAFRLFPSLNKLNLRSNSLEILDQRSFDNLSALNWLDLSHNLILELVSGTFDSLAGLIHLDLSFNNLQVNVIFKGGAAGHTIVINLNFCSTFGIKTCFRFLKLKILKKKCKIFQNSKIQLFFFINVDHHALEIPNFR